MLFRSYQQQRQWSKAAVELESALDLDPSRLQAWADLITLQLDADDLDAALTALQKASEAGHRSARHYYSVGARLFKAERFSDARNSFTEVLIIEPTHARAVRSLAAPLDETQRGVNFNSPGTEFEGVADADQLDVYPSKIGGLVYVSGNLTTLNSVTIDGVVVVGGTVSSSGNLNLTYQTTYIYNPPPGFREPPRMVVSEGSWRQVVD